MNNAESDKYVKLEYHIGLAGGNIRELINSYKRRKDDLHGISSAKRAGLIEHYKPLVVESISIVAPIPKELLATVNVSEFLPDRECDGDEQAIVYPRKFSRHKPPVGNYWHYPTTTLHSHRQWMFRTAFVYFYHLAYELNRDIRQMNIKNALDAILYWKKNILNIQPEYRDMVQSHYIALLELILSDRVEYERPNSDIDGYSSMESFMMERMGTNIVHLPIYLDALRATGYSCIPEFYSGIMDGEYLCHEEQDICSSEENMSFLVEYLVPENLVNEGHLPNPIKAVKILEKHFHVSSEVIFLGVSTSEKNLGAEIIHEG